MSFQLKTCSVFDIKAEAYVNTVNVVGVMGAGIAAEFKKRYPNMFKEYQTECLMHGIKPGDCWTFKDESGVILLNLAVKRDWREWATKEWL
jgi:O-acetyl-ADP-ribose deacetylase (regulator of RNase III)